MLSRHLNPTKGYCFDLFRMKYPKPIINTIYIMKNPNQGMSIAVRQFHPSVQFLTTFEHLLRGAKPKISFLFFKRNN